MLRLWNFRDKNCALHVIRHLMCQIVKGTEIPDAAHEFIKKLPNDLEPKFVREAPNYPVYGSKHVAIAKIILYVLDRESRRAVQDAVEDFNQGRNIVSDSSCMHYVIGNT
uniref:Uncharacterized protein n=1 Tax=Vespula pensylvanica TaxID=30213 RepID=A0A834IY96_VESPE|nr:hypothetical protein H0235_018491 [Vespula pensylvanica]